MTVDQKEDLTHVATAAFVIAAIFGACAAVDLGAWKGFLIFWGVFAGINAAVFTAVSFYCFVKWILS